MIWSSATRFLSKAHIMDVEKIKGSTQGVGRVGWGFGLKVLVLGSTECALDVLPSSNPATYTLKRIYWAITLPLRRPLGLT